MIQTTEVDLKVLNSLTKYPSIPTYHGMADRGMLLPEHVVFDNDVLYASEKVDGTNSRIILMPDNRYIIGSREELLYANGDLIVNPTLGIVEAIRDIAKIVHQHQLWTWTNSAGDLEIGDIPKIIRVFYFEMYGGKTPESKHYSGSGKTHCRLFDVCDVGVEMLEMPIEKISGWRENGGQNYLRHDALIGLADKIGLDLTPRITIESIPSSIDETYAWLKNVIPASLSKIDNGGAGKPEGIVVRTRTRSTIAKLRFEDYERYFKKYRN